MLKKWTTHSDYLSHLNREIDSLSPHEKNRLFKLYQNSLLKLSLLNLDPLLPVVKHLYPELGRPAKNQCELFFDLGNLVRVNADNLSVIVHSANDVTAKTIEKETTVSYMSLLSLFRLSLNSIVIPSPDLIKSSIR